MMIVRPQIAQTALAAALFLSTARADISFSSPAAGATISGNTISIELADGSGKPSISAFTSYTLQLCAGGNTQADYTPLYTFTANGDPSQSTVSAKIPDLSIGGDTENAYFLRTLGVTATGTVINYSDRFTLSGMTGVFSEAVQKGLADVTGTAGPPTENQIVDTPAAAPAAQVVSASFSLPYTMQSGPIRYAPMPALAPTKITAKGGPSAQYPTSAWSVWKSELGLPPPDATQTVTLPQTATFAMTYPNFPAQSQPNADMQKFLKRWQDD